MALRPVIKLAVFCLIPLLLLLAVLEFGLRGYYYLKLGGYRYRIDRLVDLKSAGPYYSENSSIANDLGFSGKGEFDPRKSSGEYRILVLGGSGAAGTRECNWPDIMSEELNNRGTGRAIRVINGGIGGHTSSEEKAWLTRWVKLAPDLIIIYDGWNDMYYSHYLPEEYREQFDISNTYYYPGLAEKIEAFLAERSILVRKTKILFKAIKSAAKNRRKTKASAKEGDERSKLVPATLNRDGSGYLEGRPFKMKLNWRRGDQIREIDLSDPIRDDMSRIYSANIREMVELASRHKVDVILVVQPDLLYHFTHHPEYFKGEESKMALLVGHEGLRSDWANTVNVLYPKIYEIKSGVARDNKNVLGVYTIDDIFNGSRDKMSLWNNDSCHQTPEGMKLIGKYMADIVYRQALEKARN
jgi:hypothetical protein